MVREWLTRDAGRMIRIRLRLTQREHSPSREPTEVPETFPSLTRVPYYAINDLRLSDDLFQLAEKYIADIYR